MGTATETEQTEPGVVPSLETTARSGPDPVAAAPEPSDRVVPAEPQPPATPVSSASGQASASAPPPRLPRLPSTPRPRASKDGKHPVLGI